MRSSKLHLRRRDRLFAEIYHRQYRARYLVTDLSGSIRRIMGQPWRCLPLEGYVPHRVLLVLTGLTGDSVMGTPLLIAIREAWPSAVLTILGYHHNRDLLGDCPLVDDWIVARADPFSLRHRGDIRRLRDEVRRGRFDLGVIGLGGQFAHVLMGAGIPIRLGYHSGWRMGCLTHAWPRPADHSASPALRPRALRLFGIEGRDGIAPQLWIDQARRDRIRNKLLGLGLPMDRGYAVVHTRGRLQRQWWPDQNLPSLARSLHEQLGLATVVVGMGDEIRVDDPWLFDTIGRIGVGEVAALIDGARLVVTTDSGPLHIAGVLGRPTVGLFRGVRDEHASRYRTVRALVGYHPLCVADCSWDRCRGEPPELQTLPCRQLASVTTSEVLDAARAVVTAQ